MFVAYETCLTLIRELGAVVALLKKYDRDLANQLQRAASSVALDLAEGRDRFAGDQRRCYEIAAGSASEITAALDTAEAWGWPIDAARSREVLDHLRRLLYGLTRVRGR